eukprot:2784084-Rhodomonas_salina.3
MNASLSCAGSQRISYAYGETRPRKPANRLATISLTFTSSLSTLNSQHSALNTRHFTLNCSP